MLDSVVIRLRDERVSNKVDGLLRQIHAAVAPGSEGGVKENLAILDSFVILEVRAHIHSLCLLFPHNFPLSNSAIAVYWRGQPLRERARRRQWLHSCCVSPMTRA